MDISLIGVPIMYGCDKKGVEHGPDKLRENGILEILRNKNRKVYDCGNLYIPCLPASDKYLHHSKIKYLQPIREVNYNLSQLVFSALSTNTFPLIIGGDHALALGSITGSSKFYKNLAIVWVDAHGDLNTFDTSPSGNFHGMSLATMLGMGEASLVSIHENSFKIDPKNVYIVGARDLDEGETINAARLNVNLYTMEQIKERGLASTLDMILNKIQSSNVDGIHLSFDIDSLDKKLVPGTGTPVENGLNLEEAQIILESFFDTGLVRSMDFVEFNPLMDIDNKTSNVCLSLMDIISDIIG